MTIDDTIVTTVEGIRSLLETESDAGGFVFQFVPERKYHTDIKLELEADQALHVDVKHSPNGITTELETRGSVVYTIPVLICVRKFFGKSEQDPDGLPSETDLDQLVKFTRQISHFFAACRLVAGDRVSTQPGEIASLVPVDELRKMNQFFGAVRVNCRVSEDL